MKTILLLALIAIKTTCCNAYNINYEGFNLESELISLKTKFNVWKHKFEHEFKSLEEEAKAAAAKLVSTTIKVGAKVGEGGKIFGSVGTLQVAEAIKAAGFTVDRKGIKITNEPIKAIGKYEATVKFGKNLTETITFEVVEE